MNNHVPTSHTTKVEIKEQFWKKLKEVFWKEKVWNFYVINKKVFGDRIDLEIRSMRINEFCDILDHNNIGWKIEKSGDQL